jgi:hypothetical protein
MDSTFQWPDEAPVNAWPYFPGSKVGTIYLYSSFWTILGELISNRYMVLTGTEYDYSLARPLTGTVFSWRFC